MHIYMNNLDYSEISSAQHWEHSDQLKGACLQRAGLGVLDDRGAVRLGFEPAAMPTQRVESSTIKVAKLCTANPLSVWRWDFFWRAPAEGSAGGYRVAVGACLGERLIVEEQWRPGSAQVPLNVVGEQAEEDMGAYPVFTAVVDRADAQIQALECAKGALDLGKVLVAAHAVLGGEP